MTNKAILVVSFGTSHHDTRKKTIEQIEVDITEAFSKYRIYRAFTSKMIISILKKRDNIHVLNVSEAMAQMKADGIEEVILQPTHLLNGIENDHMICDALAFKEDFKSIQFGAPLLTATEDYWAVIDAFAEKLPAIDNDEAVICMGHGTEHYANAAYPALDQMFKMRGYEHIYMGTVEGYPELEDVIRQIEGKGYKKITLVPFMIVAGDHAKNDMASDEEDSWKSMLEKEGYEVNCILEGLGENSDIREIFAGHIKAVIEKTCD